MDTGILPFLVKREATPTKHPVRPTNITVSSLSAILSVSPSRGDLILILKDRRCRPCYATHGRTQRAIEEVIIDMFRF